MVNWSFADLVGSLTRPIDAKENSYPQREVGKSNHNTQTASSAEREVVHLQQHVSFQCTKLRSTAVPQEQMKNSTRAFLSFSDVQQKNYALQE